MFNIADGRSTFFQWDLNRKLIVNDNTINEVHFCNKTDECSLIVEVYEEDGIRYANVPNILLQTNWRINVYGYDKDYTKHSARFDVVARTKPSDYVYTETEVLSFKDLEARVKEIEEKGISQEAISAAVGEYLEENPIEIPETDLSDYYNKAETDKAISDAVGAIEIPEVPEVDLGNYYNKQETDKAINDAVSAIEIPEIPVVEIPNEVYIGTEEPLDAEIWINPEGTAAEYALKSDIPDVTGFALKSEIPDVSGYQTAEQVNSLINTALGVIENGTY